VPLARPARIFRPFCPPEGGAERKREDLGEVRLGRPHAVRLSRTHVQVLEGDRMMSTPYELPFRVDKEQAALCSKQLTAADLAKFRKAVNDDYYFQMFYDDLPIWGFIGKLEKVLRGGGAPSELRYFLFTHVHFDVAYNADHVVEINVSTDPLRTVDISGVDAVKVQFSYSVKWKQTAIPFERRMEKYSRYSFLPQHLTIHWFSIINSCVTVLLVRRSSRAHNSAEASRSTPARTARARAPGGVPAYQRFTRCVRTHASSDSPPPCSARLQLTGFLATILMRVLKNDFVRYNRDEEVQEDGEESGWKYIHGDVFRFPPRPSLFAAVVGSGTQLLVLSFCVFALALVGVFYPYNRGGLLAALVVLYALTAGVAGFVAADTYRQFGGTRWVRNVLLTASLFCGPALLLFCYLNTVAIFYRSTAALPFGTIVIIGLIWSLVTLPLTVLGGIAGKNGQTDFHAPVRTSKYPREIPPLPWYRDTLPQMCMAGFLPFSAIYIGALPSVAGVHSLTRPPTRVSAQSCTTSSRACGGTRCIPSTRSCSSSSSYCWSSVASSPSHSPISSSPWRITVGGGAPSSVAAPRRCLCWVTGESTVMVYLCACSC